MGNYLDIQQIFDTRLSTLDSLNSTNPILWKRENVDAKSEEREVYIESMLIPAETDYPNIGISGFKVLAGTFAIHVKAVRYRGWGGFSSLVDEIIEHFPRNLVLTNSDQTINVKILKTYPMGGFYDSDGRYTIPVHIRYDSYICY